MQVNLPAMGQCLRKFLNIRDRPGPRVASSSDSQQSILLKYKKIPNNSQSELDEEGSLDKKDTNATNSTQEEIFAMETVLDGPSHSSDHLYAEVKKAKVVEYQNVEPINTSRREVHHAVPKVIVDDAGDDDDYDDDDDMEFLGIKANRGKKKSFAHINQIAETFYDEETTAKVNPVIEEVPTPSPTEDEVAFRIGEYEEVNTKPITLNQATIGMIPEARNLSAASMRAAPVMVVEGANSENAEAAIVRQVYKFATAKATTVKVESGEDSGESGKRKDSKPPQQAQKRRRAANIRRLAELHRDRRGSFVVTDEKERRNSFVPGPEKERCDSLLPAAAEKQRNNSLIPDGKKHDQSIDEDGRSESSEDHASSVSIVSSDRESGELTEARQAILEDTDNALLRFLKVTDSSLFESLVSREVITEDEKKTIEDKGDEEEAATNQTQVKRLLAVLKEKTDKEYESFCEALEEAGQGDVVRRCLLTADDLGNAREKIANYLLEEFGDIHLCYLNSEDPPVEIPTLDVNIIWERYKKFAKKPQTETLESYHEIFEKIQRSRDKQVVVVGEPGAGKTTFFKHISYEWAQVTIKDLYESSDNEDESSLDDSPLSEYVILLPVVLRLVKKNMSKFTDILANQLNLSCLDLAAVNVTLEKCPEKVIIVMDGYDELSSNEVIDPIIAKQKYQRTTVFVTTRLANVPDMRELGKGCAEQTAQICGFNQEDVNNYVSDFFALVQNEDYGISMLEYLSGGGSHLMPTACVPIRLYFMCIAWWQKQTFGDRVADMYITFVEYALKHTTPEDSNNNAASIIESNKSFLTNIGSIANNWNKQGQLKNVFTYNELKVKFKGDLGKLLSFGCLTKYHPSTSLSISHWRFSHLLLHEFFIAVFLAFTTEEEEVVAFADRCLTIPRLLQKEHIFRFLCVLSPARSDEVLKLILKKVTDHDDCTKLLDFILKLMQEYRTSAEINLGLPKFVNISASCESYMDLVWLSVGDRRDSVRNMEILQLELTSKALDTIFQIDFGYLREMKLTLDKPDLHTAAARILRQAAQLQSLHIILPDDTNLESIVKRITRHSLTSLEIQGTGVLGPIIDVIGEFEELEVLCIKDSDPSPNKLALGKLFAAIDSCESLGYLELEVENLEGLSMKVCPDINLALKVRTISKEQLEKLVRHLRRKKCHINVIELDTSSWKRDKPKIFERKNLEDSGYDLGYLFALVKEPLKLRLRKCSMTVKTIERIMEIVKHKGKKLEVEELIMKENDLEGGGHYIGELLTYAPNLRSLDVGWISDKDQADMAAKMPYSCTLTRLGMRLSVCGGNKHPMGCIWPKLPQLELLDMSDSLIDSHKVYQLFNNFGCLKTLQILDLGQNPWLDTYWHDLQNCIASLENLKALSLEDCRCTNIKRINHLLGKTSASLTHLDISSNQFGASVVEITKSKKALGNLHKLNIGLATQDRERTTIREQLQESNPDVVVYYAEGERLWDVFPDDDETASEHSEGSSEHL